MQRRKRPTNFWRLSIPVLLIAMVFSFAIAETARADSPDAEGRNVTGNKTLSPGAIDCDGTTTVTLSLTGTNGIAGEPADIALVLDRSGSMNGTPLSDLKTAANTFADIIDEATDGSLDGTIANGTRIGVVSFASGASTDQGLTANANAVKAAVNGLSAGGNTNHEAAFQAAAAMLAGGSSNDIVIMMTDGVTTAGGNPDDDAASLKSGGAELYMIGLGSFSSSDLNTWSSDPDSDYVFTSASSSDLQEIFENIGAAIVAPAATGVQVVDTVSSHFSISGESASKGSIGVVGQVVTWTIDELGQETVTATFEATHDNTTAGGIENVNVSVVYSDDLSHSVTFPNPTVEVHGCAADIDLAPDTEDNEFDGVAGSQTHTVTATVTDDFGDPVEDVLVDFSVGSGPNAGASGTCVDADCRTDASGEVSFTYATLQSGPSGLGTDSVTGTAGTQANVAVELSDTVVKNWVDTTPPVPACTESVNPNGNTTPPAGSTTLPGSKGGQNEDGYYELSASDAVWPDGSLQIFVIDSGSGTVFGPFAVSDVIKYTEASGVTPKSKPIGSSNGQAGAVVAHIIGNGDPQVIAVDGSGNVSDPLTCLVPPLPK